MSGSESVRQISDSRLYIISQHSLKSEQGSLTYKDYCKRNGGKEPTLLFSALQYTALLTNGASKE